MAEQPPSPNNQEFDELRRLLALKRFEQPPKESMDGFLVEFHRRLAADQAAEAARQGNRWWLRLLEWIGIPPSVPGDEAFPHLRRLLSLKRYEQPSPDYFENFLPRLYRRLLAAEQPRAGFWAWLQQAVQERPLAVTQLTLLTSLALLVAIYSAGHWNQTSPATEVALVQPPLKADLASNVIREQPVRVIYVDLPDPDRSMQPAIPAATALPASASNPHVHFVMDTVDYSPKAPKVYEAAFHY